MALVCRLHGDAQYRRRWNGERQPDHAASERLDQRKGKNQPFFMWLNVWDPHTPYRTPPSFENPFKDEPIPSWYTEEVRVEHWKKLGRTPHVR